MKAKSRIFILILLIILCPLLVDALGIGISPGTVSFDKMLKGGYAERTVKISTNSEETLIARFDVNGDMAQWIRFEPESKKFNISLSEPYELKIIIEVPEDARNDIYTGTIDFVGEGFGDISGRAGGFVNPAVRLMMSTTVSDEQIKSCNSGAFSFQDIEVGFPLELSMLVKNTGNVRINPLIIYDIWDQSQEKIIMSGEFRYPEVLPTTERRITRSIPNELEIGQYWANVSTDECGASSLLTFSVVERGAIADKGILEMIKIKTWASVYEPIEVNAIFRNDGSRTVYAKFKGDIKIDNRIVKVIETEEVAVSSNERQEFITYFTPEFPGRYIVSGRVIYNQKLTYEKAAVLNITPAEAGETSIIPLIIYIIIIITIIFLIRKIIMTKNKRKRFGF
ncbi:MAG: hypothetical protein PHV16_01545 [Candidatus Nanoarchaeia archaeon]|nr:hypothetical protein [Candidatus Nanoarchaeia archaeon]